MSYTLTQLEKFALSESRRLAITYTVRDILAIPKGEFFDSSAAYAVLQSWAELAPRNIMRDYKGDLVTLGVLLETALDGADLDEFRLYCRIHAQRVAIRVEEGRMRKGESSGEYLPTYRADFKFFLKGVAL